MQLNLQFGNIQLGFLVHSPSLAQAGQLGLESLILELQLFLQLTNIQSGFLSHWPVLAQYGELLSCPLLCLYTWPRIVGFRITGGRGVVWLLLFLWGIMFFHQFFFQLNLVVGFALEFFNPVIRTQIFLQSRNPHAGILIPLCPASLTHKNPWGTKKIHLCFRVGRKDRSIDHKIPFL